jgi:hypothetical protein
VSEVSAARAVGAASWSVAAVTAKPQHPLHSRAPPLCLLSHVIPPSHVTRAQDPIEPPMPLIPHFVPNVTLRDHVIPPVVTEVLTLSAFLKNTEPVARFRLHLCPLRAVPLLTDWNLFLPGMLTRKLLTLLHETFPVCKQPLPYRSCLALGCLEFTLKHLVLTLKFLSRELACL